MELKKILHIPILLTPALTLHNLSPMAFSSKKKINSVFFWLQILNSVFLLNKRYKITCLTSDYKTIMCEHILADNYKLWCGQGEF